MQVPRHVEVLCRSGVVSAGACALAFLVACDGGDLITAPRDVNFEVVVKTGLMEDDFPFEEKVIRTQHEWDREQERLVLEEHVEVDFEREALILVNRGSAGCPRPVEQVCIDRISTTPSGWLVHVTWDGGPRDCDTDCEALVFYYTLVKVPTPPAHVEFQVYHVPYPC